MTKDDRAGRRRRGPDVDLAAVVRQAFSTLDIEGADLAREAGLPPGRFARIRRGTARPTPDEVAALADALADRGRAGAGGGGRPDLAERVLRMALEMDAEGAG